MNTTATTPSTASSEASLAADCVTAGALGLVWAVIAVALGASVVDGVLLVGLGGLSQLLALLAWDALKQDVDFRRRVLWACSGALAASLVLGRVLLSNTHHRPLGAVTWTLLVLCVGLLAWAVAGRLMTSWVVPAALLGVLTLAALLQASAHLAAHAVDWLQLAVGIAAFATGLRIRRVIPSAASRLAWLPALWMVGASAVTVMGGFASGLHERAPVVAGLVGLLF